MTRGLWRRAVGVLALLGVLFGLCVWFATLPPAPAFGAYPTTEQVAQSPTDYVGQAVTLSGTVVETDPAVVVISHGAGTHRVTVVGLSQTVERGDTLRLFGTLTDSGTVRVTNGYTVTSSETRRAYVVSIVAGLWVLGRLALHWRVDATRGFVRRSEPVRLARRVRDRVRGETTEVTESDA